MPSETDIKEKRKITTQAINLHFFDEVYRVYVVFMITPRDDLKQFLEDCAMKKEQLDDLNLESASGYCVKLDGRTTDSENNCFLVWLEERQLPTLVHEITHLGMMVFDEKCIPIQIENQEALAYYIEHWIKRIIELWDHPIDKRKRG